MALIEALLSKRSGNSLSHRLVATGEPRMTRLLHGCEKWAPACALRAYDEGREIAANAAACLAVMQV
jgi:hypothetical protein